MKILKKALRKILLTTTVRNIIKKYLVGNLGKVVEEDDKLICYVKKNKNEYSPQQATGYLPKAMLFLLLKFQI